MPSCGLGFAISGACNLLNGKWQRDFQREQNELSQEFQRTEHEVDRKRDDARYDEKNMWPLDVKATTINRLYAEQRTAGRSQVLVITADSESVATLDKVSKGAWKSISSFLDHNFPSNSRTSVDFKIGQFTRKVKGQEIDVQAIYSLIPMIPTILIAPQTMPVDDKCGFLVAAWGEGISTDGPIKNTIDFDLKHNYVEAIRSDTKRFLAPKDGSGLVERVEIKKNREIFEKEQAYIAELKKTLGDTGTEDWVNVIDEQYNLYDMLKPTASALMEIQRKIEKLFKLFFTVVSDSYFTCVCGEKPKLPEILQRRELEVESEWDRNLIGYYASVVIASCKIGRSVLEGDVLRILEMKLDDLKLLDEKRAVREIAHMNTKSVCQAEPLVENAPDMPPREERSGHSCCDGGAAECWVNIIFPGEPWVLLSPKIVVLMDGVVVGKGDYRNGININTIKSPGRHTIEVKALFVHDVMRLELRNAGRYKVCLDYTKRGSLGVQKWKIEDVKVV